MLLLSLDRRFSTLASNVDGVGQTGNSLEGVGRSVDVSLVALSFDLEESRRKNQLSSSGVNRGVAYSSLSLLLLEEDKELLPLLELLQLLFELELRDTFNGDPAFNDNNHFGRVDNR